MRCTATIVTRLLGHCILLPQAKFPVNVHERLLGNIHLIKGINSRVGTFYKCNILERRGGFL